MDRQLDIDEMKLLNKNNLHVWQFQAV